MVENQDQVQITGAPLGWKLLVTTCQLLDALRKARLLSPGARVVLSISCVSLARMSALNYKYRRKRRPTDVLSFEQRFAKPGDKAARAPRGVHFLGDIVLCPVVVRRQAREQRHGLGSELAILLAHGLLHLLGFDHERSPQQDARMARAETRILRLSGLLGPEQGGGAKSSTGLVTRSKVRIQAI